MNQLYTALKEKSEKISYYSAQQTN